MTFTLGIDIGTSKAAAVIVEAADGRLISAASNACCADIPSAVPGGAEQDPARILLAVDRCIAALDSRQKSQVAAIGVTGQMHGVLAWHSRSEKVSPLITWQDRRCNQEGFLSDLGQRIGDNSLRSGYGCATLAWLARFQPQYAADFDSAATIYDYLVQRLCALPRPLTDPGSAASWGCFNLAGKRWETACIEAAGIAPRLMPEIRATGTQAGRLCAEYARQWELPAGIPVATALGDNQASLHATLKNPAEDVGITLGTGGQLAAIISAGEFDPRLAPECELRPFIGDSYAVVAASLCGGSAVAWLPRTIEHWCRELGISAPAQDLIFSKIIELGLNSKGGELSVHPHFIGERTRPGLRGSIEGISEENFTIGALARALGEGVLLNLKEMFPAALLEQRRRVVGSGNAIRKSALMQQLTADVFGLPLELSAAQEEAAQGAALLAAGLI